MVSNSTFQLSAYAVGASGGMLERTTFNLSDALTSVMKDGADVWDGFALMALRHNIVGNSCSG
jgi:hypothetical protein